MADSDPAPTPPANLRRAIETLASVLERKGEEGAKCLPLTEEARRALEDLPAAIARGAQASAPAAPDPAPLTDAPCLSPAPSRPAPAPAGSAAPAKAEKLTRLREAAENDEACRGLGTLRDTMVFAVGNPDARLMFIGEAPGAEEERLREPFVGPAGQLLTRILQTMGLKREDVYISNIVKFRPAIDDGRPQSNRNRKPTAEEMEAAVKYVLAEIDIIQPEVIVALGGTAAEGLLGETAPVSRLRNSFHELKGIPVMITFHPSYLLRNPALSERRKVWEDMLLVMDKLGMPISEKQRGFFSS